MKRIIPLITIAIALIMQLVISQANTLIEVAGMGFCAFMLVVSGMLVGTLWESKHDTSSQA